jgi:hypothetical protein
VEGVTSHAGAGACSGARTGVEACVDELMYR